MSSTFVGLSSSPYLLASAVCWLPLLMLTPCQLPLCLLTTHQLHLEASSTPEVASTAQPRTTCLPSLLVSTTCSVSTTQCPTVCVSTTCLCRPPLLASTTCWCQLLLLSTSFGNTVCCSKHLQWAGYGPRILGQCRPTHSYAIRDSGPQETAGGNLGHASTKFWLLMAKIGSSIVSSTLHTFDPAT